VSARALWAGPLPDPAAPAAELAARLAQGADYAPVLAELQTLAALALPVAPALEAALVRWDWSIDLARVAVEAEAPGALDLLAARVAAQGRRPGVLARALWAAGQTAGARAALHRLDPASPSHPEDLEARFDLALAAGDFAAAEADLGLLAPRLPPGAAARLRLRLAYDRGGAAGLAAALAADPPGQPGPWAWALPVWLAERDFARARAALDRLASLRDPADPEHLHDAILLALEVEDPARARGLAALLPPAHPADWPLRRHIQHTRLLLAEGDRATDPAPLWQAAADHAARAVRLHPSAGALAHLAHLAADLVGDWDARARALTGAAPATLVARARLGWPEPHRAPPPAPPPEAAATAARLACELHLLAGDPTAALAALDAAGPPPTAPLAAWLAEWRAEALLALRRAPEAAATLAPALAAHPTRMGLWLQQARAAFFAGDFDTAEGALDRFRALKAAQLGAPPAEDLRDRITADARAAVVPLGAATAQDAARHPGLAAAWLARPGNLAPFAPGPDAIPPRLGHYWDGPLPGPARRGAEAWARLHPGWAQTRFDQDSAAAWLAQHDPEALPVFTALAQPAVRADLFRLCWLAQGGGVWADLDEFPRAAVDGWLTGALGVVVLEVGYGTVANNFLAAAPGLPLIAQARADALAHLAANPAPYPWWDSGPARLTVALAGAIAAGQAAGLRVLSQGDYCARVATNLPFPHKRRADHWRAGPAAVRPA
jgi:hypothetical protein